MPAAATLTLADFLLARIADDEEFARLCLRMADETAADDFTPREQAHAAGLFNRILEYPEAVELLVRFVGNRVKAPGEMPRTLAECEAKRTMMALHRGGHECPQDTESDGLAGWFEDDGPCPTLHALALPYVDHPDFRQEWRP